MRLLVDINHPAHVHLFRNAIKLWKEQGHTVIVTARDKEVTTQLLNAYKIPYHITTKASQSQIGKIFELFNQETIIYKLVQQHDIQICLGTSVGITHVSKITPCKSFMFNENDSDLDLSSYYLAYPFADAIIVPDCLRDKKNKKYITYPSYQELAYLHPQQYQADNNIYSLLGISPNQPYFILRFVAFKADHDIGHKGLSSNFRKKLVKLLSNYGKVFITSESSLEEDLEPYKISIPVHKMHDALNYAALVIGDSETMCSEAAVLGVPAIRCNTFVGKFSVSEELNHRYGLSFGFLPNNEEAIINKVNELLHDNNTRERWKEKREMLLKEKIDLTSWIVEYVLSYYKLNFH